MWCSSCRADVAAELSTDNRRMLCARCQTELGIAAAALPRIVNAPRTVETERDARELLARWSTQNLLDVVPPASATSALGPVTVAESIFSKGENRFDPPRSSVPAPSLAFVAAVNQKRESPPVIPIESSRRDSDDPVQRRPKKNRQPRPVETSANAQTASLVNSDIGTVRHDAPTPDHDQIVRNALHGQPISSGGWTTFAGQICAYGGVALLTCGSVLVMWSYFGGPANFMPTGWLSAAVGQMLLFLGVVTLISSGLDQTVAEVAWRIDHLADEVHQMGQALDRLETRNTLRQHASDSHQTSENEHSQKAA